MLLATPYTVVGYNKGKVSSRLAAPVPQVIIPSNNDCTDVLIACTDVCILSVRMCTYCLCGLPDHLYGCFHIVCADVLITCTDVWILSVRASQTSVRMFPQVLILCALVCTGTGPGHAG